MRITYFFKYNTYDYLIKLKTDLLSSRIICTNIFLYIFKYYLNKSNTPTTITVM